MSPQYTIDCSADASTQEACTVTQKLDLDQMSDRSIRILELKEQTRFLLQILGLFASYDPIWMILMIFATCYGV